jgi:hypothetical protein
VLEFIRKLNCCFEVELVGIAPCLGRHLHPPKPCHRQ